MKRIALLVSAAALIAPTALAAAPAQDFPPAPTVRPIRVPVRHADPGLIKALIEGQFVTMPELSTLFGGPEIGNAVSSLLSGWRVVINPTNNSIWLFPDRRP